MLSIPCLRHLISTEAYSEKSQPSIQPYLINSCSAPIQRQCLHVGSGTCLARLQRIRTGAVKPRCARVSLHGPTWSSVEHQTALRSYARQHDVLRRTQISKCSLITVARSGNIGSSKQSLSVSWIYQLHIRIDCSKPHKQTIPSIAY
jgi:hypothetical protein